MANPAPRSGAAALGAIAFAGLVIYASLYPFTGWRWPPGRDLVDMLVLPWPRWRPVFDLWTNWLGYVPLGGLVCLAVPRRHVLWGLVLGVGLPASLSYGAEVAQHFLPGRHPSLLDLALNSGGALTGALLGLGLRALGWVDHWRAWRARWFERDSSMVLLLLTLWPVGLLFPAPVALGLGQVGPRLRPWLAQWLEGVPWAEPWHAALLPASSPPPLAPSALTEGVVTMLGLLAPCLVAFCLVAPGWRRAVLSMGAAALAVAVMTLSTALNFSPEYAFSWWTPATAPALVVALALALALTLLPRRVAPGLGLIVLTALVTLVAQAPADPYFALSLRAWEQGRFIHLHGVAQWVGWLWPYAAMVWLLTRLGAKP